MAASDKFNIDVSIDASGVSIGTDKTIEALGDIGSAVEQAGKAIEKTTESTHSLQGEQLGSIRTAHHFIEALIEIQQGGPNAAAGLAMLTRIITEMTEGVIAGPLAPLVLIISTLAAVGIPMLSRAFGDSGAKAKSGFGEAKDAAKELEDKIKELETQATDSYGNMLRILQDQTAEMLKQVQAQKDLQRAKDELQNSQMAGKIADLDDQEQNDLVGKSESQQAVIKRNYEKKRIALRQQDVLDKAKQELQDRQDAAKAAQGAIDDKKNEAEAEGAKLTQAYGVVQGGAASGVKGIKSDAQVAAERLAQLDDDYYNGSSSLSPEQTLLRESLQKEVPALQQKETQSGPDFTEGLKQLQAQLVESQEKETGYLATTHLETAEGTGRFALGANEAGADVERGNQVRISAAIDNIEKYMAAMAAAQKVITAGVPLFEGLNRETAKDGPLDIKRQAADANVAVAQQRLGNLQKVQHTENTKITASQAREIAK